MAHITPCYHDNGVEERRLESGRMMLLLIYFSPTFYVKLLTLWYCFFQNQLRPAVKTQERLAMAP